MMLPANAVLRSQVLQLAVDISVAKTRLAEMEAQLVRLQRELDAVIYPVLSLPPEIMSEIFIHCLPPKNKWHDSIQSSEAPLLLSQICSQWRRIALSTPALWANLDIDVPYSNEYATEIVKTWLGRACYCPLSVKIQGPITDLDDFPKFYKTLRRHAPEIKFLELVVSADDLTRMPQHMGFSLLRDLVIRFVDFEAEEFDQAIEAFSDARGLLQAMLEQIPPNLIALPWQQLRKLTGKCYTLTECMEALSLMPNITECTFSIFPVFHGSFTKPAVFSHPGIRTFTLCCSLSDWGKEASSAEILEFVTFPNLESLELLDVEKGVGALLSFFLQDRTSLKRLVIRSYVLDTTMLTAAPLMQPHLTELEIWYPEIDFSSSFFEDFGEQHTFVPGLQKLTFYCRHGQHEWEDRHEELVARAAGAIVSRRKLQSVTQLRVFHAYSMPNNLLPPPRRMVLATFKRLAEEGIDVYIGTEDGRNNYIQLHYATTCVVDNLACRECRGFHGTWCTLVHDGLLLHKKIEPMNSFSAA